MHEADNDVGSVGRGQLRNDVREERVVAACDETPAPSHPPDGDAIR